MIICQHHSHCIILVYKGIKLAVVEAKSDKLAVSEGVAKAKLYAQKLNLETTYSTNGNEIYQICLKTGTCILPSVILQTLRSRRIFESSTTPQPLALSLGSISSALVSASFI
jgi:type I site-specific restriction endonuclease